VLCLDGLFSFNNGCVMAWKPVGIIVIYQNSMIDISIKKKVSLS